MIHSGSSNCTAIPTRPPVPQSVSLQICPLCPSMQVRRELPRQSPSPNPPRPGKSFSPPGGSPGPSTEVEGLCVLAWYVCVNRNFLFSLRVLWDTNILASGTDGNEGVQSIYCCVVKVWVEPRRELATLNNIFCIHVGLSLEWIRKRCVMMRVKSITIGFLLANTTFDSWIPTATVVLDLRGGDLLLPHFHDLNPLLLVVCVV